MANERQYTIDVFRRAREVAQSQQEVYRWTVILQAAEQAGISLSELIAVIGATTEPTPDRLISILDGYGLVDSVVGFRSADEESDEVF